MNIKIISKKILYNFQIETKIKIIKITKITIIKMILIIIMKLMIIIIIITRISKLWNQIIRSRI